MADVEATAPPIVLVLDPEDGKATFPFVVVVGLEEGEVAEIGTVDALHELKVVNWPCPVIAS